MSKKKAIVVILVIASLALIPIAMYGTEVDVAEVSFSLSVGNSLPASSSLSLNPSQIPSFVAGISNVDVNVKSMNPYQYLIERNTARTQMTSEDASGQEFVEITIVFELITPANTSLTFTITPGSDQGTGTRNIVTILGPEDGITTTGTFHLSITINIKVTPPRFDNPVVDLNLEPVSLDFVVP